KDVRSASLAFGQRLREAGLLSSMGSRGDCFDNALAESFFATRECAGLARQRFPTRNAARLALFDVHRGVLQHAPPAFRARIPIPRGLREEVDPFPAGHLVVRCPSNRGNSTRWEEPDGSRATPTNRSTCRVNPTPV
ncbi:MAG: hypothetical protein M3R02_31700, partial [Chloroflexota bacterium]|nr:hypothetical protein [Chloroflexota bacterium]